MHLKRWITGLSALPFLFALIYKGGERLFAIVITVFAVIGLWEYFRLVFKEARPRVVAALGFAATPLILSAAYARAFDLIVAVLSVDLLLAGMITLKSYRENPQAMEAVNKQLLGLVYIPLGLAHLVLLRGEVDGMLWTFWLLCVVFAGDIGALYTGFFVGRHKLCPAVSPKKTVEGSIGGLAANVLVGALFKLLFVPHLPWGPCLFFFVTVGAAAQAGDLFESILKRAARIKDSGTLLPGHGGVLDRADALLFAAPVAYYFKQAVF